ncbi:MAG: phosphatase [Bacteroidetes bacterium]|nr:phosphatase [Bacteroidota bacterium]MBS1739105.1 phosphatase [Bacteroidota bacterium]MBS1777206.1 phosphatase [Bacteroidota bacterium]
MEHFKGTFITEPVILKEKLNAIRAYVFDWDGVFNRGEKNENGSSPFNEIDSMGTNLLRFNHYLRTGRLPKIFIISGENNIAAQTLARREKFDAVYSSIKFKTEALDHICHTKGIKHNEIVFAFDDVLDFSVAAKISLRFMVTRSGSTLLTDYAIRNKLVDYLTFSDGGHYAVREIAELLMSLGGQFDETLHHRINFTDTYQRYLQLRQLTEPEFFTSINSTISKQPL